VIKNIQLIEWVKLKLDWEDSTNTKQYKLQEMSSGPIWHSHCHLASTKQTWSCWSRYSSSSYILGHQTCFWLRSPLASAALVGAVGTGPCRLWMVPTSRRHRPNYSSDTLSTKHISWCEPHGTPKRATDATTLWFILPFRSRNWSSLQPLTSS
jgi:hypothetical protein